MENKHQGNLKTTDSCPKKRSRKTAQHPAAARKVPVRFFTCTFQKLMS